MSSKIRMRGAALSAAATALAGCLVIGFSPITAQAAAIPDLQGPGGINGDFGGQVLVLSNGNFVVVDKYFDSGVADDIGSVSLYTANDQKISTVTGATAGDQIGSDGVFEVSDGDFVILSGSWHKNGVGAVGAATWVDATTGIGGTISAGNSLTGTSVGDFADSKVTVLANGNYVISNPKWGANDVGAVTWEDGTATLSGSISASNSIVGASTSDMVGSGGITALTGGDYVVASPMWDGHAPDAGAVTWASGNGPTHVAVAEVNSIAGLNNGDMVGSGGVTALTNGNYVIASPKWNNGNLGDAGAATWADGSKVTSANVATGNSIVGGSNFDMVGSGGVTALSNGNYVVISPLFNKSPFLNAGAATWANGAAATSTVVTDSNSLIGASSFANVGAGGVTALSNGNYVISSPYFSGNGRNENGAATWAVGTAATSGVVAQANSIIGANNSDAIGSAGVTALAGNGNYVISSPQWGATELGAVTWASGAGTTSAIVSIANSLVGTTPADPIALRAADQVGSGGAIALSDGNYVVASPFWNGSANNEGAATWLDGTAATAVAVDETNSLHGTVVDDNVGGGSVKALAGGRYVVSSPLRALAPGDPFEFAIADAGAATFGPAGGVSGAVAPIVGVTGNSVIGTPGVVLGQVLAASPLITKDNTIEIATSQARVLRLDAGVDFQPPTIVQGDIKRVSATPVSVTFAPVTTDNVGVLSVLCNPASGSSFPVGITPVTCTASDTATPANTTLKTFKVIVTAPDTTPPQLTVPQSVSTSTSPGSSTATVIFDVTATDNVGVQSTGCTPPSGSQFPVGVTQVTCTVTDTSGQTTTKTFNVTVTDQENPVFAAKSNITVAAPAGASSQVVSFSKPDATDNVAVQSVVCDKASGASFPVGVTTVHCTATDTSGNTATTSFTITVTPTVTPPPPPAGTDFVSMSPARLADSRPGQTTVDHLFEGDGMHTAGSTMQLTVTGRGGVSADASAVGLNVTAVGATGDGFVTVFPCGSDQPTASNLNFTTGSTTPNAVIAKVGANGKVCLFVSAATHLVVDANGYFPPTSSLVSMNPARVLETRDGMPTIDGQQQGGGARAAGSTTSVQITGRASIPAGASAAILNVTVTEASGPGFATVFPCGATQPTASSINFDAGMTVANMVVSKIGDGGAVCIFASQGTQVIVDVAGYFPATTTFNSLVPARLMDTRPNQSTIDGLFLGAGPREAGEITELQVTNRGGVPSGAATVVLNVTVTEPSAEGFLTVYPCGVTPPLASNLNFLQGSTVANAVIAKVGVDGKVCFFNSKKTQIVVDVNGFFPAT